MMKFSCTFLHISMLKAKSYDIRVEIEVKAASATTTTYRRRLSGALAPH